MRMHASRKNSARWTKLLDKGSSRAELIRLNVVRNAPRATAVIVERARRSAPPAHGAGAHIIANEAFALRFIYIRIL